MLSKLLDQLEQELRNRNPILADRLRRGRSELLLRKRLKEEGAVGNIEPIVSLFSWKDGTDLDSTMPDDKVSPFPGSGHFMFMPFSFIVGHFASFKIDAKYHQNMARVAGRFFPIFWNGSKGFRDWIAVDLASASNSQVVLIDPHADDPIYPAYQTFEEFIADAIQANRQNTGLKCF